VPAADEKIVFDKFHIAQSLNQAVDQVRRSEQRRLGAEGDTSLKWTRFEWLRHPGSFTRAAPGSPVGQGAGQRSARPRPLAHATAQRIRRVDPRGRLR
jgi:hypothetical protein